MKILYIASWFPYPADNGARIRTYNLMKSLAKQHEVFLISLLQDDSDPANAAELSDICTVVSLHESRWFKPGTLKSLLGFFSTTPRSVVDRYQKCVRQAVQKTADVIHPDVIVASTLGAAVYVPHNRGIRTVLDEHNCEYAVIKRGAKVHAGALKRLRYDLSWKKAARWEAEMCRKFSSVAVVSKQDADLLLAVAPDLRLMHVVPNGVDITHYLPSQWNPEPGSLLYNGALTYDANLDAVRFFVSDVYPSLAAKMPNAKLRVTGRTTGVDLTGILSIPNIELTGYVPDIRDVLYRSAVCVVPLRQGGGSRLKILEAMAAGVPVVSTTMGAEGLNVLNGTHLLLADTPSELTEAILAVNNDRALAGKLSREARRLVEDNYSWDRIGEAFTSVVTALK